MESEDESHGKEWTRIQADSLLDQFLDVTPSEKHLFKLWNRWIEQRRQVSYFIHTIHHKYND